MKIEKILLPIDIRNCPLDIFPVIDRLASRPGVTLTILHVVTLNILAPESRIYDDLAAEAGCHLQRLAREILKSAGSVRMRVRIGKLVDEVLAEANSEDTDLIILVSHGPSYWQRLSLLWRRPPHPLVSSQTREILEKADRGLFIALSRCRFDCERHWGRPVRPCSDIPRNVARRRTAIRPVCQRNNLKHCLS
jgi:nucleotide-binding universal stress UspA family protein